jgi:hypothetical protein
VESCNEASLLTMPLPLLWLTRTRKRREGGSGAHVLMYKSLELHWHSCFVLLIATISGAMTSLRLSRGYVAYQRSILADNSCSQLSLGQRSQVLIWPASPGVILATEFAIALWPSYIFSGPISLTRLLFFSHIDFPKTRPSCFLSLSTFRGLSLVTLCFAQLDSRIPGFEF